MYIDDNMVTAARSGDRRLAVAEEERIMGMPDGATNFIEKRSDESREGRQARRHSLLAATIPLRIMALLLEAVVLHALRGLRELGDPLAHSGHACPGLA